MRNGFAPRSCFLAIVAATLLAGSAIAEEWTSPDGAVAVAVPSADGFVRMDDPPDPFLVLWVSNDDTLNLGVSRTEVPPGVVIDRASVEEGFAEETHGTVTNSSTAVKNAQEVWIMTADGTAHGASLEITQAITQIGTCVYKAMAASVGTKTVDHASVDAFVNSFEIKQASPVAKPTPVPHAEPKSETEIDTHNLSKWIGGGGMLLLIGLMAWWFVNRGKTKT